MPSPHPAEWGSSRSSLARLCAGTALLCIVGAASFRALSGGSDVVDTVPSMDTVPQWPPIATNQEADLGTSDEDEEAIPVEQLGSFPPPDGTSRQIPMSIIGRDGALAPGVTYSALEGAVMDQYLTGVGVEPLWELFLRAIRKMREAEKNGKAPPRTGPLGNVTYDILFDAVLKGYGSTEGDDQSWSTFKEALETMYRREFDGQRKASEPIIGPDGSLAPYVTYRVLGRAVMDEYIAPSREEPSWQRIVNAIKKMREAERNGEAPPRTGPLANVTYQDLLGAVLERYYNSIDPYDNPWPKLKEALEIMYKAEFDGEPVPIDGQPYLYVGSAGAGFNYQALRDEGITHVVSLTSEVSKGDFEYLHIKNVHDEENYKLAPYFPKTSTFIEDSRTGGGKVLVHCWEGKSRSVTILIAYLIKHQGITRDAALTLVRRRRPWATPNANFMAELEHLERTVRKAQADSDDPLPKKTPPVLDADGSLAKGVMYSTIRRGVLDDYMPSTRTNSSSWETFEAGLQAMRRKTGQDGNPAKKRGPLANVSYAQLREAVTAKYIASNEEVTDPWEQLQSSLWAMWRLEVDGEPVPIFENIITTPKHWLHREPPFEAPSRLFVGSAGAAFNRRALKDAGITHIVSVTASVGEVFPDDFAYYLISHVHDTESAENTLSEYFESTFDFIQQALNNGGKVFVHCQQGQSRSVTIMAAYLMRQRGLGRDNALAMVRYTRTEAKPDSQYMDELEEYGKKLRRKKEKRKERL